MLAIKTGEVPVVEMLIKAGANVNAKETFHNQTALMWAAAAPQNARRDGEAPSFEGRRRQASGAVQRLAEPDYVGAPRAVSSGRGADRVAVCGTRRLL